MWQSVMAVMSLIVIVSAVIGTTYLALDVLNRAKSAPLISVAGSYCYRSWVGGNYSYVVVVDVVHRSGEPSRLLRVSIIGGGENFDVAFYSEGAAFTPSGLMVDGVGRVVSIFFLDKPLDSFTVVLVFDNYMLPFRVSCVSS